MLNKPYLEGAPLYVLATVCDIDDVAAGLGGNVHALVHRGRDLLNAHLLLNTACESSMSKNTYSQRISKYSLQLRTDHLLTSLYTKMLNIWKSLSSYTYNFKFVKNIHKNADPHYDQELLHEEIMNL